MRFRFSGFYSLLLLIGMVIGCTRITTTDIGSELIPPIDGVNTLDTFFDVVTDVFVDTDTLRMFPNDNHVIGAISNDPQFGTTLASTYFEVRPPFLPFVFPGSKDSLTADSAVLMLDYKGFWGDTLQPVTLSVYEISQLTPVDTSKQFTINPTPNIQFAGAPLITRSFDPRRLRDSLNTRFEQAVDVIRFPLPLSFAQRFMKQYDSAGAYASDSAFKRNFAGFAITGQVGNGNIVLYTSLLNEKTKLGLYFTSKATGATRRDTSVVYFRFNSFTTGHANLIQRNRAGSEMNTYLQNSTPDSILHVQTGPGTFVRIRIPGLANLTNRIIHRAELQFTQVPANPILDDILQVPGYLFLGFYDSVNQRKRNIPSDFVVNEGQPNLGTAGGIVRFRTVPPFNRVAQYTFDISRYVQGIATRRENEFDFRLYSPVVNDFFAYSPPFGAGGTIGFFNFSSAFANAHGQGRVRLGGGNHSTNRVRLRIIYTKI